jgi:hypothetical protein
MDCFLLLSALSTAHAVGQEGGGEFEVVEVLDVLGSFVAKDDAQKGEGVVDFIGKFAVGEVDGVDGKVAVVWIVGREGFVDDLAHLKFVYHSF